MCINLLKRVGGLKNVLKFYSPNSKEAMELLSIADPPSKEVIERATAKFLDHGVGPEGRGHVVIRCDEMGAYVACRQRAGVWVDAFWTKDDSDKVVDVTGTFVTRNLRISCCERVVTRCRKQFSWRFGGRSLLH